MPQPLDSNPMWNPFFSSEDRNWVKTVEERYALEDEMHNAIAAGNIQLAQQIQRHTAFSDGDFSYLGGDPVEMAQRMCRIVNVSGRIAARRGGLPALYLHNMSEKFGIIITRTRNLRVLRQELPVRIITEYATAVSRLSTHGYGKLVNAAVRYLSYHITEKINIQVMADELFVSEAYLARRFRRETGRTITDYANHLRVDMAKLLFEEGRFNVTEIALRVGYRDASYFCKVFHRITGMAPREYVARHVLPDSAPKE